VMKNSKWTAVSLGPQKNHSMSPGFPHLCTIDFMFLQVWQIAIDSPHKSRRVQSLAQTCHHSVLNIGTHIEPQPSRSGNNQQSSGCICVEFQRGRFRWSFDVPRVGGFISYQCQGCVPRFHAPRW
jgi:hypothetical protein